MVRYSLEDVDDEMVLGESIVLPSGKLLLGAGTCISKRYKERLKELGYQSLLINEPGTENVRPETIVSQQSHAELSASSEEATEKIAKIMDKFRASSSENLHKLIFEKRRDLNKFIMNSTVARQLETIIEQIMNQSEIVLNLAALKGSSNSYLQHAVNVTITSLCIGKKHNFSYEEIKQLATGALNYHMGLTAIPKSVLNKKNEFTESERKLFRKHTVYGYLMLSQNSQIPATSAIVALQHHELQNGKGYPMGLKGSNRPPAKDISQTHVIHRFAEIVSVADTYHTLISVEDPGMNHTKTVIKKLIKLGGEYLNREIVKTLISIVPVYPVGARVRITDAPSAQLTKYIGVICKDNPNDLSRPQIILYETTNKQRVNPPILIDTAKAPGIQFELYV
ncbi:MAG: HD-GYP domain-containing protein [Fibrobacterota bacterium]